MKILLVGMDWHGGITQYCKNALKEFGHELELFMYEKTPVALTLWERARNKLYRSFRLYHTSSKEVEIQKMNNNLLSEALALRPDMLFIIKGETIFPETLEQIKKKTEAVIISWWIDNPLLECNGPYILKSTLYIDHLFIFDTFYVDYLKKAGFKNVSYLPFACDPKVHKKVRLTLEEKRLYSSDVSFLGIFYGFRQEILSQLFDYDLKIWGIGDKAFSDRFKGKVSNRLIPIEEATKIYNASKIVLNINHPQSVNGTNTRTFESAGCAAFQLTENKPEMKNLFLLGEEAICYSGVNELRSLIKYYLEHPEEREKIAKRGQARAYQDHTYKKRMQTVLETIG